MPKSLLSLAGSKTQDDLMKKSISLALSLLFLTHPLVFAVVPQELPRLTNQEVVEMLKAGLSAEGVISKIKASRCNFDTDPSILAELKYKGVRRVCQQGSCP